jgi:GPH family glycoside/pentoside/hexuronide:cation symporter
VAEALSVDTIGPAAPVLGGEASAKVEQAPLSAAATSLYAAGDLVDGVVSNSIAAFAFFYMNIVCGLSGSVAGALLAISIAVDAVMDPLIGYLSDNTHSRWGRRHPFMLVSAVPVALGLGLFFSVPAQLSGSANLVYVMVVLLTVRIAMSGFTLPYGALGAEISTSYTERSTIVAYRTAFNNAGFCAVIILGYWVFLRGHNIYVRADYAPLGWSLAAVVLIGALVSALTTGRLRGRLQQIPKGDGASARRFAAELIDVFRNRSFLVLFLCILLFWAAQGVISVLGLHASKYFWKLPPEVIGTLPFVTLAGGISGIPIAGMILQKVDKRLVSIWGLVVLCVVQTIGAPLRILGWLPDNGMPLWVALGGFLVVSGWAATSVGISFLSMLADAADEHELLFGSRREGLYFAGLTFSAKAAIGIGSMIGGVALDAIHFPRDAAKLEAGHVAVDVARNLGLIAGPIAGLIALSSAAVLIGYRLDARRYAEIQAELAARKVALV